MRVLITGGCGYIGTHAAVELVAAGHDVVLLDDLGNSRREAAERVAAIAGASVPLEVGDCADRGVLEGVFGRWRFDAVMHFAGLKSVGESVREPLRYYRNNVDGLLSVCEAMAAHGVRRLVFSSSATVYGDPDRVPVDESAPLRATNPYGGTKLVGERVLRDLAAADPGWRIGVLRYFNPIGAHESGLIGEDPEGVPSNLFPFIAQVAAGARDRLLVFGDDYDTPDGTGVRDYLHVVDLALGHVAALEHLDAAEGLSVFNLGTGTGTSVLEAVAAFERASGRRVPYEVAPRRPGDIAVCFADPGRANRELGWSARRTVDDACADAWRWQTKNPRGYVG
ncbi:UDP-glucose 4-epimerase GalE [Allonocardiopsis opalescens]|uniref:UDP-glucose 4-epimerase n=1 Tax=Allonocardiopsis opalescens TaxID=1144618 RepID=A0A2T0PW53_9ACTN|nr:UDP-glucose 4-epimerase GalE [Allonocardiopsis opalescens]PRX95766.1 UDP-glucose 4-epimerase [Allonocardiopsis opalescens]